MFAMVGIVLSLLQAYLRPPQPLPDLLPVPLAPLFVALGLFGLAVDLKLRKSQLVAAPQLGWALALVGWTIVGITLAPPGRGHAAATQLAFGFALFFLIAQGVQRFRALATVAATLLLLAIGRAALSIVQRSSPLEDPDATALALAVAVPFAFAFWARRRTAGRLFLLLLTIGLVAGCVIMTRSRAGQVAFVTVLAVYLVQRYGGYALLAGVAVAAPLALRGGGPVGQALASADGGLFGAVLWASMIYVSFKLIVTILRRYADDADATVARVWAWALLASLAGVSIGALFVSRFDGVTSWIYVGLTGALYQATRAHDPKLAIRFDRHDLVRLAALAAAVAVVFHLLPSGAYHLLQ